MQRVIGKQHKIARGILKAGQLAGMAEQKIGQIHLDKHPLGSMVQSGLKGFSTLAPKLSVLAESAGDIKSAGQDLREGFKSKDFEKTLMSGAKLYRIAEKVQKTKAGDVVLKDKKAKIATTMDEPPKMITGGDYGAGGIY